MSWRLRAVGWLVRALLGLRSRVQPSVYSVRPGALLILETDREMPAAAFAEVEARLRAALSGMGLRVLVLHRGVHLAGVVDVSVPAPNGAEGGRS